MEQWIPYLIAFVIGLLVGIEREKAHPRDKTMGVRTFILISLSGAVAGGLSHTWFSILVTAFAFTLISISYFNQTAPGTKGDPTERGLTTEFAAGLIFAFGYASHEAPTLAALGGPLVAVILLLKRPLHHFTSALKPLELEAALFIFLGGVIAVGLVPDKTVDPWGVVNPKKFAYLILILAMIEFLSYVITKLIGDKKGSLLAGFLGGFVSSTAVFLSTSKQAKKSPQNWRALLSTAMAAQIASLVQLFFIVGFVSMALLQDILIPAGASVLLASVVLGLMVYKIPPYTSSLELRSPLDWRGVLRLAVILGTILIAISFTQKMLGDQGTKLMAFLTGLFELHGISLATATMFSQEKISQETAHLSMMLAIAASLLAKLGLVWALGRGRFAQVTTLIFIPMIVVLFVLNWPV